MGPIIVFDPDVHFHSVDNRVSLSLFRKGGGEWSPPEGGIRAPRGEMARDAIATINFDRY